MISSKFVVDRADEWSAEERKIIEDTLEAAKRGGGTIGDSDRRKIVGQWDVFCAKAPHMAHPADREDSYSVYALRSTFAIVAQKQLHLAQIMQAEPHIAIDLRLRKLCEFENTLATIEQQIRACESEAADRGGAGYLEIPGDPL